MRSQNATVLFLLDFPMLTAVANKAVAPIGLGLYALSVLDLLIGVENDPTIRACS